MPPPPLTTVLRRLVVARPSRVITASLEPSPLVPSAHQKQTQQQYRSLHQLLRTRDHSHHCRRIPNILRHFSFDTESAFHSVADETLETIQDAIDACLEDKGIIDYELTLASGVLTLQFLSSNATWVINKQTPNQQLWWSSPMSGPKRFAFDAGTTKWVSTKEQLTLGQLLVHELQFVYPSIEEKDLILDL
jgi:frataxin